MPVYLSARIQEYLVGNRCDIVGALCVYVAVSHDPFSALLEVFQRVAYGLHRRIRVGTKHSCLNIYTFNLVVILGFFNGIEYVVESHVSNRTSAQLVHDAFFRAFVEHSRQVEHHYRVVAHVLC